MEQEIRHRGDWKEVKEPESLKEGGVPKLCTVRVPRERGEDGDRINY